MAPPSGGMCSRPVIWGRQSTCKSGPATTLDSWYCTQQLLECRSAVAAQRYPGSADADEGWRSSSFTRARNGRTRAQLAQMFWLAVREEKLGDGVGLVA